MDIYIEYKVDETIDGYKANWMQKGYTQTYEINYEGDISSC